MDATDFVTGAAARWARIAQKDPSGSAAGHVAAMGPPPADLVRQQLRKLDRPDKKGVKADATKVNARAHAKAVKAAQNGVGESQYSVPDLVTRGRGSPMAAGRMQLGLMPSEVFRTGGARGVDSRFNLSEQRELLRQRQKKRSDGDGLTARGAATTATTVEGAEDEKEEELADAEVREAQPTDLKYIDDMRPAKAKDDDAPTWLVRLSQDVPSGESFWR